MRIHLEHEGSDLVLEIMPNPILNQYKTDKFTGIRRNNQIMLSEKQFFRFHAAIVANDFTTTQEIIGKLLDVTSQPGNNFTPYLDQHIASQG
jgi:hypothetical protein